MGGNHFGRKVGWCLKLRCRCPEVEPRPKTTTQIFEFSITLQPHAVFTVPAESLGRLKRIIVRIAKEKVAHFII